LLPGLVALEHLTEDHLVLIGQQPKLVFEIPEEIESDLEVDLIDVAMSHKHRLIQSAQRLVLQLAVVGVIAVYEPLLRQVGLLLWQLGPIYCLLHFLVHVALTALGHRCQGQLLVLDDQVLAVGGAG